MIALLAILGSLAVSGIVCGVVMLGYTMGFRVGHEAGVISGFNEFAAEFEGARNADEAVEFGVGPGDLLEEWETVADAVASPTPPVLIPFIGRTDH